MIGTLYRYPHPHDTNRFIYCGQGAKRDQRHRSGKKGFGCRFKKIFPSIELPQPIREQVEVENQLELNELETIWMFQYHTWHGYEGGMNLTFPGSTDYTNMGLIGGPIVGRKNVESGLLASICRSGGFKTFELHGNPATKEGWLKAGRIAVENGQLASLRTAEHQRKAGRERIRLYGIPSTPEGRAKGGRSTCCLRWNIRRGKLCVCGTHGKQNVD